MAPHWAPQKLFLCSCVQTRFPRPCLGHPAFGHIGDVHLTMPQRQFELQSFRFELLGIFQCQKVSYFAGSGRRRVDSGVVWLDFFWLDKKHSPRKEKKNTVLGTS